MKRTRIDDTSDDKDTEQGADEIKHKKPNECRDDDEVEYFEQKLKEANEGLSSSQFLIGHCYTLGFGTAQNLKTAIEWYQKAADQSHVESCFELGLIFEENLEDEKIADEWKNKAVSMLPSSLDQVSNDLLFHIGELYYYGFTGYEESKEKAMEYFTKSANKIEDSIHNRVEYYGAVRSMNTLGKILASEKQYSQAIEWLLKSAELGDKSAMCFLGAIYSDNNVETIQDYKKAMEWFLKCAELGNNDAMLEIGRLYHNGFGVEKDLSKAIEWCLKSAKLNHEDSMEELSDIYMVQNNYLESSIWLDRHDNYQVEEYTLIENPVENFGKNIIQLDDDVFRVENCVGCKIFIIRLNEGDMKVNGHLLNKIPFFKTMMNENWMKIHEEEGGITILDLKSIQSDDEAPLEMNLLEIYFKMKQDESTTSQLDALPWVQLFNLAEYFTDSHFKKNIIEKVGLIERWYLLNMTTTDYLVLELYLLENIQIVHNLPLEIIQSLIHDDRIHRDTRMKIIMERQTQQTLESDLEDIRILLTQPKTSIGIIPKLKVENSTLTQVLNCTLDVQFDDTIVSITITNTAETTDIIQVYMQTHFKCLSNKTILKSQGHLLKVGNKPIVLKLHSPFKGYENFEFEFSGLVVKMPISAFNP